MAYRSIMVHQDEYDRLVEIEGARDTGLHPTPVFVDIAVLCSHQCGEPAYFAELAGPEGMLLHGPGPHFLCTDCAAAFLLTGNCFKCWQGPLLEASEGRFDCLGCGWWWQVVDGAICDEGQVERGQQGEQQGGSNGTH